MKGPAGLIPLAETPSHRHLSRAEDKHKRRCPFSEVMRPKLWASMWRAAPRAEVKEKWGQTLLPCLLPQTRENSWTPQGRNTLDLQKTAWEGEPEQSPANGETVVGKRRGHSDGAGWWRCLVSFPSRLATGETWGLSRRTLGSKHHHLYVPTTWGWPVRTKFPEG